MAGVSGSSSSYNSLSSQIRGYGGLASGLDRDTLIEQITQQDCEAGTAEDQIRVADGSYEGYYK